MKTFASVISGAMIAVVAISIFSAATVYQRTAVAHQSHEGIESNSATMVAPLPVVVASPVAKEPATPDKPKDESTAALLIAAPERADVGVFLEIDASASVATNFRWIVAPGGDNVSRVIEGGKKLLIACSKPCTQTITVACSLENGTIDMKQFTIDFTLPGQKAIAKVDPAHPAPALVKPAGSPLATAIINAITQVASPNKELERVALAGNFNSVASMISAGVVKTPEDALTATANLNREALGTNQPFWSPFTETVRVELNRMAESGKLKDIKQHEIVWREIAIVLKASE